jgi:exonuclease SbcD
MKIVICGDSHIGAVFGLGGPNGKGGNSRIDDYEKTLNFIIDYCIENSVDVFVQTGDAFDKRNPTAEQMEIMNKALKRLSFHNIFSVVIMGNHDYKKTGPTFASSITGLSARDLPNVRTVLNPEIISLSNGGDNINLLLMPFRDRKQYAGKSIKEDTSLYEQEVMDLIASKQEGPIVAIGHNFFYEGSYNDYGGTEVLPRIESFKGCDLVAMGHYHNFKILKKADPIAVYTGSMEKINFGDANSKKIFLEYNTESKRTKVLAAPVRELWDESIDLTSSTFETVVGDLESKLSVVEVNDKIVRLKIIIHEKLSSSLNRSSVEKRLYELGSHYVSKVNFEQIYQRLIRDTSILEEKDDYSMFKAFIEGQGFDAEMEKRILLEVETIIG